MEDADVVMQLLPALLGVAPPTIPPTLKSVYVIDASNGWIVGSPVDFSHTSIADTKPLASILRFVPFGGALGGTSTVTIGATAATSTLVSTTTVTMTTSSMPPATVTISIKITDNQGNPVQGANVTLPSLGLSSITNAQGIVTFTLPPGVYPITITKNGISASSTIDTSNPQIVVKFSGGNAGIPGFPVESVIGGFAAGLLTLIVIKHRRTVRSDQR